MYVGLDSHTTYKHLRSILSAVSLFYMVWKYKVLRVKQAVPLQYHKLICTVFMAVRKFMKDSDLSE